MNIDINLKQIIDEIMQKIENSDTGTLEYTEREYFGKDGVMTRILKSLPHYSIENRKKIGFEINKIKNILKNETRNRKKRLKEDLLLKKINKEKLDYSPAFYFPFSNGSFHPVVQAIKEMLLIFKSFGFSVIDGPEIETDWYNFQALNIPKDHPAKDIHDTFYVNGMNNLLRTHTSPGQIHAMESQDPPIKIVVPGRVYRNESSDASHSSTFHQIEGLKVDKNVTFSDLKIILVNFIRDFFCDKLN
ncbi:MAG: phenylalanine--tRNA ligase subunit alpha, partial [Endomicrobium sp.]|nr:phenylalanine--tRNA ligase subunit alpha [Endomicrobium sp.]